MAAVSTYDSGLYDTAVYDGASPGSLSAVQIYVNGAWTDITQYVRVDTVVIRRGQLSTGGTPQPATCQMTLDNRDGRFSPRYTGGAYYPYLTRNTKIQVAVLDDSGVQRVRFAGYVSEWPVYWDQTGRESTVSIEASGFRRRLAQNTATIPAPYKGGMLGSLVTGLVGYWPMEDGASATMFGSALSGGPSSSAWTTGVTPAADNDTFDTSEAIAELTDGGSVSFTVPDYATTAAVTVRCLTKVSGSGGGIVWRIDTSGAHFFAVEFAPATNQVAIAMYNYAATGGVITGTPEYTRSATWSVSGHQDILEGCRFSIELRQNGTGIDNNIVTYSPNHTAGTSFAVVDTIPSSTLGKCTKVTILADPLSSGATATIGHVSVQATTSVPSIYDISAAVINAYNGEAASTRVVRLCNEQGIPANVDAGLGSVALGPQQKGMTFLDLIDDIALCDDALSTEYVTDFAIEWRARSDMYSRNPVGSFVYGVSGFPDAIQPVDDDQLVENDVTVVRTDGASARATQTTGNLGTATIGAYAVEYDLNLWVDSQVADQAAWRLTKGTIDAPRYPVLRYDVRIPTSSAARNSFIAMREGDTIAVSGLPGFAGAASQRLRVLGWTEEIQNARWIFTLNCVPADPWDHVFILNDASWGILDTDRLGL